VQSTGHPWPPLRLPWPSRASSLTDSFTWTPQRQLTLHWPARYADYTTTMSVCMCVCVYVCMCVCCLMGSVLEHYAQVSVYFQGSFQMHEGATKFLAHSVVTNSFSPVDI